MIALHGKSYWDVIVAVPIATVAGGKGKVDARSNVRAGGLVWNAARALAATTPVHIVTAAPAGEAARLAAMVPAGATLECLVGDGDDEDDGWLPVSVVLDPGGACRILRDRGDGLDARWHWSRVSAAAAAAKLHVLARLPEPFVADAVVAIHARGGRTAWCGGAELAPAIEPTIDLLCVNAREAAMLTGLSAEDPAACAHALATRAERDDAVRVVTGGGGRPTVAVHRVGGRLHVHTFTPTPLAPAQVVTLFGAGDAFAAAFVRTAALDLAGAPRAQLAVAEALAAGQAAAERVVRGGAA